MQMTGQTNSARAHGSGDSDCSRENESQRTCGTAKSLGMSRGRQSRHPGRSKPVPPRVATAGGSDIPALQARGELKFPLM